MTASRVVDDNGVAAVGATRREFIRASALAGGGLLLTLALPRKATACVTAEARGTVMPRENEWIANAWIRIAPDNTVTLIIDKSEMGQGAETSMALLLAEELGADWNTLKTEFAPADTPYKRAGGRQITGGSTSVRFSYVFLRKMGATARDMLIAAAAQKWNTDPANLRAERSRIVSSADGRSASFGELASLAATMPVPTDPMTKAKSAWTLMGTPHVKKLDTPKKVDGSAQFGIDVRLPGMKIAMIERCPVFDGVAKSFNATRALKVKGVVQVVQISTGIAIVAENTWAAMEGRKALTIEWDEGATASVSSAGIRAAYREAAAKDTPLAVRTEGDAGAAMKSATKVVEAEYDAPYLHHATMEPMNFTADVRADRVDLYGPTQAQTKVQDEVARLLGFATSQVKVHTTYLGGGFGRRLEADYAVEAAELSRKIGGPVQVLWTRPDDMTHGFYRPSAYGKLACALDASGAPVAWTHRIVSPGIFRRMSGQPKDGPRRVDGAAIEGASNHPYAIKNVLVDYVEKDPGIPTGAWRSVGSSQNAFITECFIDEVAQAAGKDPYEFRRALLKDKPRHLAVLDLAAKKAGWGTPLPKGRGRGIAVAESFGSWVAEVAEVSVAPDGTVKVHKVVAAVDCGTCVNPDGVEAQISGGIIFGLSAALFGAITIDRGRVVEQNFDRYRMVRMSQVPEIEVYIVPSDEAPGGVGEPGVPPVAPAVVNAIAAATGKRHRSLPLMT